MRVELLNDGGYEGVDGVTFPVEVEAIPFCAGIEVPCTELARVGWQGEMSERNPIRPGAVGWVFMPSEFRRVY